MSLTARPWLLWGQILFVVRCDLAFHAGADPVSAVPHDGITCRRRRYSGSLQAPVPALEYLGHRRHCSDGGRALPDGEEILKVDA